jgi:WXG100 family type VII secretion target
VAGLTAHDSQLMAQAATQVSAAVGQIRALQGRLDATHETAVGGWKGTAATTFTSAFTEFNADFSKVIAALDNLGEKLRVSGTNYATVEQTNTSSANKVISALNH